MIRKFILGAFFLFIAWAATSCKSLTDCQFCKIVTRTNGGTVVDPGYETEYCGTDLITFKATPTVVDPVTHNVTKVECR
jgi:hypothetical protein